MDLKRLEELYKTLFPYQWAVSKHLPNGNISIVCPMGDAEMGTWMIAQKVEWEQHAEFIVENRNALPLMVERIKELEEVLMDVSVSPGKDPCWCIDFDKPEHDEGCQKARKALKIETGPT